MGSGRIDGRPVMVAAEDFTVKAGTISGAANAKRYRVAEIAVTDRVPLVMMLEGAGFRADGTGHGARTPTDMLAQARCSGRVPLVTAVLGASAGHGALVAPMSDFTRDEPARGDLHRRPAGRVRVDGGDDHEGGPRRSRRRGRQRPDPQRGPTTTQDALDLVRAYLALLPVVGVVVSAPHRGRRRRSPPRARDPRPRAPQRPARLRHAPRSIDVVFDAGSCFEVQPDFGRSLHLPRCAGWAGTPSRSSPTSRRSSPARSTPTPPTRPRTSSPWPTRSTSRSCSSPTTPACCAGSASEQAGDPAQGRPHVRGADAGDDAEVRGDDAQGVRLRLDGDGHDPVRRPVGRVRVPGGDDGRDGRGGDEPLARLGRGRGGHACGGWRSRRPTARRRRSASTSSSTPASCATSLLHSLERAAYARQAPAEPVARIGITP